MGMPASAIASEVALMRIDKSDPPDSRTTQKISTTLFGYASKLMAPSKACWRIEASSRSFSVCTCQCNLNFLDFVLIKS